MKDKSDVWQGTLSLMVLKTLNILGPQHGYGIARRIEQTSENVLSINHGTLYPVLLKLEQEGSIASEWGISENNRKARFYRITRDGKRDLAAAEREMAARERYHRAILGDGEGAGMKPLRRGWRRLLGAFTGGVARANSPMSWPLTSKCRWRTTCARE